MLDVNQIRTQFPILSGQNPAGKPLIYLDNAATTQKPWVVIESLQHFYSTLNANIHRGIYHLADQATTKYELARQKVAAFINARESSEVVFCSGTTGGINMVAQGWGWEHLKPGDELLVTAMEHHANYVPWQTVCKLKGACFRVLPINQDGTIDIAQLQNYLTSRTKLLAVTHISNTLGTINRIEEIIRVAHLKNIPVLVDGAQSIAFDNVDVQALDCDFFVFSGHKAFGPMGIGALYGKLEHLASMHPFQQGGSMIYQVSEQETTFKDPPYRFEAGTPAVAEAIAMGDALDFISGIGLKPIKEHAQELVQYARHKLSSVSGLELLGPKKGTGSILSFQMANIHPHDVATILSEAGIAVRAGHHCTQPLMQALGISGTVRISFSIYNSLDEVDALVKALQTVNQIMV